MDDELYIRDEEGGAVSEGQRAEALLRRLLRGAGDVRIHDSSQAGEMARRLGARAFTAGRDVYVQPELVRPLTARSVALLAHEIFHAAEQSGAPGVQHGAMPMPLLLPPRARTARGGGPGASASAYAPGASSTTHSTPVQRQVTPGAPTVIQREISGSPSSESSAQNVEAQALQEQANGKQRKPPPDPNEVAERVYDLLMRDLLYEKERAQMYW